MRPKSLILLSLALGCGLIATLGINQMMSKGSPVAAPESEKVDIFVAAQEIRPNDVISEDNIRLEKWPADNVPTGAMTDLEEAVGRKARMSMFAGEPVRADKLLKKGESTTPAGWIRPGYRVVALKADAESTGGYVIKQGDHVDLMVYLRKNQTDGIDETVMKTFLQNIRVFAIGGDVTEREGESIKNYRHISLEMTPEEAAKFKLASHLGKVDLSLRSTNDPRMEAVTDFDAQSFMEQLLGRDPDDGSGAKSQDEPKDAVDAPAIPDLNALAQNLAQGLHPPAEPWSMQIVMGADVKEFVVHEGSWIAKPKHDVAEGDGFLPALGENGVAPQDGGRNDSSASGAESDSDSDEDFDLNDILND